MKTTWRIVFLLFAVVMQCIGYAQVPDIRFENYTQKDGLPNASVRIVMQDSRGFVWIGTAWGLARYDGRVMKTYTKTGEHGLSSPIIESLAEDKKGNIWIGTGNRISRLDPFTDSISNFSMAPATKVFVDRQGKVWAGGKDGIFLFDEQKQQFGPMYPVATYKKDIRLNRGIYYFFEDSKNRFWLCTSNGMKLFDREKKTYRSYAFEEADSLARIDNKTICAFEDKYHNVWAGTWGACLLKLNEQTNKFERVELSDAYLQGVVHSINGITIQGQYYLVLGTENGLVFLDPLAVKDGRVTQAKVVHRGDHNENVLDEVINTITKDRQNNYWVGTSSGLQKIDLSTLSLIWTYYPAEAVANNQVNCNFTRGLHPDMNDGFFTNANGWQHYDLKTKTFSKQNIGPENRTLVLSFYRYLRTDTGYWFTTDVGFGFYDPYRGISRDFSSCIQEKSKKFGAIGSDRNGKIWLGSFRLGLRVFDPETKKLISLFNDATKPGNFLGQNIYDIKQDKKENMLVTVASGVCTINPDDYSLKKFEAKATDSFFTIERTGPRKIVLTKGGRILLQGQQRIYEWKDGEAIPIYPKTGGTDFLMYNMIEDESGKFIILANTGLFVTDSMFSNWVDIKQKLGFDNADDIYELAKVNGGSLLVTTEKRFCNFNLKDIAINNTAPVPLVSKLRIGNTQSFLASLQSKTWQAKYDDAVEFEVAAINFLQEKNNRIYYRLKGWDNAWKEITGSPTVRYEQLPPGDYSFEVKAANGDGITNAQPTSLSFVVLPPVWRTWWFITICIVVLAASLYGAYRYRINQVIKEGKLRTRIATDLHDDIGATLSSISFYSEAVKQQTAGQMPQLTPMLNKMGETSRDMVTNMSDIVWAINPDNDSFDKMLNRMHSYAAELCAVKNVHLHFPEYKTPPALQLKMEQRRNFYLIFKEALNNALKYAEAENIYIALAYDTHALVLTVKDDGVGFTEKHEQGNGLKNMKMRAEEIGSKIAIQSSPEGTIIELNCKIT